MSAARQVIEFVMDILETIVFIGSLFIVTYLFIIQPNQVKGASMDPNYATGDYIFTSKVTYKFRKPERGDTVVFHSPKNPDIEYIKRVIAVPGDTVKVQSGIVYLNGKELPENYISVKTNTWEGGYMREGETITIPEGYLFVLGDNRPRSSDSREFGPVPMTSIIGHVFYRYFPPNKMGPIKNPLPTALRSEEKVTVLIHSNFV